VNEAYSLRWTDAATIWIPRCRPTLRTRAAGAAIFVPRPPFAVCAVLVARHTAPPPRGSLQEQNSCRPMDTSAAKADFRDGLESVTDHQQ
jgi:hypothetical protein